MTAQLKYISSILRVFSTFLDSLNISHELAELSTQSLIIFLQTKKDYAVWPVNEVNAFIEKKNIPFAQAELLRKFVRDYPPREADVFLYEFLTELNSEDKSESTLKNYRSDITQLFSAITANSLQDTFTPKNIRKFVAQQLALGLKEASVRRKLASIEQFAVFLEKQRILQDVSYWISDYDSLLSSPHQSRVENHQQHLQPATHSQSPNNTNDTQKVLKQYLSEIEKNGYSYSTLKNYRSDLNQFIDFADKNSISELLTADTVTDFVEEQKKSGLMLSSIKRKFASISQFVLWSQRTGLIPPASVWLYRLQVTLFDQSNNKPEILNKTDQDHATQSHNKGIAVNPLKLVHAFDSNNEKTTPEVKKQKSWHLPLPTIFKKDTQTSQVQLPSNYSKIREVLRDFSTQINSSKNKQFLPYMNLLLTLVFIVGLGFLAYKQFIQDAPSSLAYPTSPVRPNRELSFQGRLTDTAQNPITTSTVMEFRLFDTGPGTGGTELWDTTDAGVCNVTPDQDGIFNVGLGDDCGNEITEDVFTENSNVWLEVTVAAETLTPRQSIKTVAYALNSETVQGYPISATGAATTNTILTMDSGGQVLLGEMSPSLKATSGSFSIEAQTLTLQTSAGSNGNIILDPNGTGTILLNANTHVDGYLYAPGATLSATYAGGVPLTVKAGPSATANITEWQNSSGTVLNVVDEAGNVGIGTSAPELKLHLLGTNAAASTTSTINGSLALGTGDVLITQGVDGNNARTWIQARNRVAVAYYPLALNPNGGNVGVGTTTPAQALDVVGNLRLTGTTTLNTITYTWPTSQTTNYVLQTNGSGTLSWVDPAGAAASAIFWNQSDGALYPKNSTVDLLVGGQSTASAKFAFINNNSGTPTASISGNLAIAVPTGADPATTYNILNGGSFNLTTSAGGNTGSTSRLFLTNSGNVGVGSTSPRGNLDLGGDNAELHIGTSVKGYIGLGTQADYSANWTNQSAVAINTVVLEGTGASGLNVRNSADSGWGTVFASIYTAYGGSLTGPSFGLSNQQVGMYFPSSTGVGLITSQLERLTVNSAGNVGIGSTSPNGLLQVSGAATGKALTILNETGDQAIFVASDSGVNRFIIQGDGNVGIGTTTTNDKLVISGGMVAMPYVASTTLGYRTFLGNTEGALWGNYSIGTQYQDRMVLSANWYKQSNGTNVTYTSKYPAALFLGSRNDQATYKPFQFMVGDVNSEPTTTAMIIEYTGNVGIGTTTAAYKLDLTGEFNLTDAIRVAGDAGTSGYLLTSSAGGANTWTDPDTLAGINWWDNTLNVLHPRNEYASIADLIVGGTSTASADTQLFANGSAVFNEQGNAVDFRVESDTDANALFVNGTSNNVGIGTSSPSNKLHVTGITRVEATTNRQIDIGTTAASYSGWGIDGKSSGTTYNQINMYNGNDGSMNFTQAHGSGYFSFNAGTIASPTELVRITRSGNVGIGTTAPTAKLSVNGDIFANTATISATYAGGKGLVVKGGPSGTANIQEWQNSAGTVLSKINEYGEFYFPGTSSRDTTLTPAVSIGKGETTGGYSSALQVAVDTAGSSSAGVYGLNFYAYARPGDGNTNAETHALVNNVSLGAGTTTELISYNTRLTIGAGASTSISLFNADAYSMSGGTVTNLYGINIPTLSKSAGTLTNQYGIYLGNVDQGATLNYAIVTNAGNVVFNDGGDAATDFRVEGDTDANLLFTDASTDNIGIGTNTPAQKLDVVGNLRLTGTTTLNTLTYTWPGSQTANYVLQTDGSGTLSWVDTSTFGGANDDWSVSNGALYPNNSTLDLLIGGQSTASAKFAFINNNSGTPTATVSANLSLQVPTGSNPATTLNVLNGGALNIRTATTGQGDAGLNSRLYVANSGNIGINTTNPQNLLHIVSSTANKVQLNGSGTDASYIVYGAGSTTGWLVGKNTSGNFRINNEADTSIGLAITGAGLAGMNIVSPSANWHVNQAADGQNVFLSRRATDSSPTGNFLVLQNAAASVIGSIDVNSNMGLGGAANSSYRLSLQESGISQPAQLFSNGQGSAELRVNASGSFEINGLTAAKEVVFNQAGSDVDLRVEGDTNANLLFVDASGDNIGIGTSTVGGRLQINGGGTGVKSLLVRGNSSNDGNIQEWQNGSGTALSIVDEAGWIGIGNTNPSTPLAISSSAGNTTAGAVLASYTSTYSGGSTQTAGAFSVQSMDSASSAYMGLSGNAQTGSSGSYTNSGLTGVQGSAVNQAASGTVSSTTGVTAAVFNNSGGAITNAQAYNANLYIFGAGNVAVAHGFRLQTVNDSGAGSFQTLYGMYLTALTAGTSNNYGIWGEAGDWILDEDGDGAAGGTTGGGNIVLGEGQDLELYHDGTNSYIMNNTGDLYIGDAATDDVILSNNGGNVGIGSTTPGYKLDLVGEFNLTDAIRVAGDAGTSGYILTSSGGGANTWTDPSTLGGGSTLWANTLNVYHPKNEYASIVDLVIGGTSTASADIQLFANGGAVFNEQGNAADFRVESDTDTSALFVNGTSNNVGIGTNTPGAKLDVNGNILLAGTGTIDTRAAGTLTIGGTTQTGLTVGRAGATTTVNGSGLTVGPTAWTATPTISGLITASSGVTLAANQDLTFTSGTGRYVQTFTNTTTNAFDITANSLTSGKAINISSSATAFTGNLIDVTLSGSNAANTGSLLSLTNSGTSNTNTALYVKHYATGTNNLALRVDDVSGDTSPFVIDGNGNVGVGTTAPLAPLDVAGDIYLTSGLSTFRTAVSDGIVEATTFCTGDGETNCTSDFAALPTLSGWTDDGPTVRLTAAADYVAIGAATSHGKFGVTGARTGQALVVLDETGDQNIWTASASGTTVAHLARTGYLTAERFVDLSTSSYYLDPAAASTSLLVAGNVGIGTTTAGQKLDVAGEIELANYLYFGNAATEYLRWDGSNFLLSDDLLPISDGANSLGSDASRWDSLYVKGASIHIGDSGNEAIIGYSTGSNYLGFDPDADTTNEVVINDDGNVGIGSTAPKGLLNIVGGAKGKALAILDETGDQAIFVASDSGTNRFIIQGDGNVGISTATPGYKLDVNGSSRFVSTMTIGTNGFLQYSSGRLELISGSGGQIALYTDSSERLRIGVTGNIGINDSSADAKLEVLATTEQLRLTHTDNSVDSRFTVDGSGDLTIDNTGTKTVVADDLQVTGNDLLDSGATSRITIGNDTTFTNTTTNFSGTTTIFGSSLATFNTSSDLTMGATTTLTLGSNSTLNGGSVANDDLTLQGTSNATRTTSYVLLQPTAGNVGIGTVTPTKALDINGDLRVRGDDISDSGDTTRISLGATTTLTNTTTTLSGTTTLTASSLATLTTSSSLSLGGATSLTFTADNATLYGSDAADGDITIHGTSNATRTSSYVLLQPTEGNVGIGTTTPAAILDIQGPMTTDGSLSFQSILANNTTAYNANPVAGQMFYNKYTAAGAYAGMGGVTVGKENTTDSNYSSYMALHTRTNGSAIAERVRITSAGNVGIGTSVPTRLFHVSGSLSSNSMALIDNTDTTDNTSNAGLHIRTGATATTTQKRFIVFSAAATNVGRIRLNNNNVAYESGGADFAEYFTINSPNEPGDIIAVTNKTAVAGEPIVGVVSDTAAFVGNAKTEAPLANQAIVGFVGQIATKVSTANGPIQKGDPITAGPTPGVGVKATETGMIVGRALEDYSNPNPNAIKRIAVYVNPNWYDPNIIINTAGLLDINGSNPSNYTATVDGTAASKIVAFADAAIARIQAGLVTTRELVVQNTASIANLSVESLQVGGQTIESYIVSVINNQNNGNGLVSPVVGDLVADSVTTENITASGSSTLGSLLAENVVVTNDITIGGDASVSGTTTVQNITALGQLAAESASISGEIIAETVTAESIRVAVLEGRMAELENVRAQTAEFVTATVSGTLFADNIDGFGNKVAQAFTEPSLLELLQQSFVQEDEGSALDPLYDVVSQVGIDATTSADLKLTLADLQLESEEIVLTGSAAFINNYLRVNGSAYVSNTLAIGNSLLIGNGTYIADGVLEYTAPEGESQVLAIQPSGNGSISLLAGLMELNENGQVIITGNLAVTNDVKVSGSLLTNLLQPEDYGNPFQVQVAGVNTQSNEVTESRFEIVNELGTAVATISAQGKAEFAAGIGIGSESLGSNESDSVTANKTSGRAIVKANTNQIIIKSELIKDNTLIYVTPVGSTENKVLYVKSQTTENTQTPEKEGEFVVGFDESISQDAQFNWWIVN